MTIPSLFRSSLRAALSLLVGSVALASASQAADLADYARQEFTLPKNSERMLIADLDADGAGDLIVAVDNTLLLYFQRADSFDFDSPSVVTLPGNAVGWDVASGYGSNESLSIVALIDGDRVLAWHFEDQVVSQPQELASNLGGFIARGINRLHFSRDITGDGLPDLIIPGAGLLNLHIRRLDGSYQSPLSIESEMRMRTALNNDRLERRSGQSLQIPQMNLRDVNGDQLEDLVSRTSRSLDVFLAQDSEQAYFPRTASYSVDIAAIEERLGEFEFDNLDFSNLTGVLALTHEEILEDLNGDGIEDLVLREGGKVSLFAGNDSGMDQEQPLQVLRSSGNVLGTFLYDEDEDGLKDLWLWRVEPISVGDIFVWLALSGSVAVEAFIYPNDGERFSRRPARKLTVNLRFPSVLRLSNTFSSLAEEIENTSADLLWPTTRANVDTQFENMELVALAGNQLRLFMNVMKPELGEADFLGALDYQRDRDNYEINLREIIDSAIVGGNADLRQVEGKSADQTLDLGLEVQGGDIASAPLNGDGIDDLIIFAENNEEGIRGVLLISR